MYSNRLLPAPSVFSFHFKVKKSKLDRKAYE